MDNPDEKSLSPPLGRYTLVTSKVDPHWHKVSNLFAWESLKAGQGVAVIIETNPADYLPDGATLRSTIGNGGIKTVSTTKEGIAAMAQDPIVGRISISSPLHPNDEAP